MGNAIRQQPLLHMKPETTDNQYRPDRPMRQENPADLKYYIEKKLDTGFMPASG